MCMARICTQRMRVLAGRLLWICFFCTTFWGTVASAVVRDDRIEPVPGLRFQNVVYTWDSVLLDVVNMTDRNLQFGGTAAFLDRSGQVLAEARFLPRRAVRHALTRYVGYFSRGSGEAARRAVRVLWDVPSR